MFEGAEGKADVAFQFIVDVVGRYTVILDENDVEAPQAATDVNVILNRTIKADEWSTICLPFIDDEATGILMMERLQTSFMGLSVRSVSAVGHTWSCPGVIFQ